MKKKFVSALYLIGITLLLASCSEDFLWNRNGNGELPVEFNFNIPVETRGILGPKTSFVKNDVIHIQGTFYYDPSEGKEPENRYGAMKFNGTSWESLDGSKLTWPNTSVAGKFKAYYVKETTGVITTSETPTYLLSDLKPDTDPLMAPETELLSYGHSVNLNFNHLCTYLSLLGMQPVVSTSYMLVKTDDEGNTDDGFFNAYRLTLSNTNELDFEWQTVSDPTYTGLDGNDGLVYVKSHNTTFNKENQTNFFLAPGMYDSFSVRYPTTAPASREYLQYTYIPTVDTDGDNQYEPDLEPGRTYTLNITKSQGVTIVAPPEGNPEWDDYGPVFDIVVEDFLRAVANMDDYYVPDGNGGMVQILKRNGNGVNLLHNVNFHDEYYTTFGSFVPEIRGTDQLFDGNYHYINNVGCTIFQVNEGHIKNLGIKNATKARMISDENDSGRDFSRKGLIVGQNTETGHLDNIRIVGDINIQAFVNPENNEVITEAHNIGVIVGSNVGSINEIYLSGNVNLNVSNNENTQFNSTVMIGGIAGQNAGNGIISNVSVLEQPFSMAITNNCIGNGGNVNAGAFYVGGFAGQSSAVIEAVNLSDISINGTSSLGVVSYMGGMVGQLQTLNSSTARLTSSTASGVLRSGASLPYGAVTSESCTGGIAGALQGVSVTDCRTAFSIYGVSTANSRVIYATGGAFGLIRTSSPVNSIIAYGDVLTGLSSGGQLNGLGNFAGLLPAGQSWSDYQNNNITVKQFRGVPNIGGNLSQ